MRVPMSCMQCSAEKVEAEAAECERALAAGEPVPENSAGRPLDPSDWYLADLEEDNAYVETCRNGHTMRMSLQNVRYELLFESGIVAMLVGFHREAVSSIASALERFFEFAVEVFSIRAGMAPGAAASAWKLVAKQSERQFGAFAYLFLVNMKRPFLEGSAWSEYQERARFRNGVIHEGKFPSRSDTEDYAKSVFELIRDTRAELVKLDGEAVKRAKWQHLARGQQAVVRKAGPPQPDKDGLYWSPGGAGFAMMLSTIQTDAPTDFETRLAEAKSNLWLWGFPGRG
jgi:hypothetical protein